MSDLPDDNQRHLNKGQGFTHFTGDDCPPWPKDKPTIDDLIDEWLARMDQTDPYHSRRKSIKAALLSLLEGGAEDFVDLEIDEKGKRRAGPIIKRAIPWAVVRELLNG